MNLLRACVLAFACFSQVPMPQLTWHDDGMRYMMCFFPLVGVVSGGLALLWWFVAGLAGFGAVLTGIGLAAVPVLGTGGIHLDGFCDVVDAQASHAEPARKREILKDPHVGAFAVIGVAVYLLVYVGFAVELVASVEAAAAPASGAFLRVALVLALCQVLSRCASGIATVAFAQSSKEGMLAQFQLSADKRRSLVALVVEFAVVAVLLVLASVPAGIACVAGCLACLGLLPVFARRQFGGMSGDLAGFFLQVAELVMLVCLVCVVKAVGL